MHDRNVPLPEADQLRAIVEALVFAAEEPLTLGDLKDLFPGAPLEGLQVALDDVIHFWEGPERGLQIIKVAGGCRMTTRPELGEWVRALFRARNRRRLSPAALETLAIVAYRQPITTPEIHVLRGTDPGGVLQTLLDRRLLRVVGRKADFIIRGGKNISGPAVEEAVATHPAVALAAAVAMPDPVYGERVCVYVELRPGAALTLDALRDHLAARGTTREWWPERLIVLPALPRASGGKVAKGELRADIRRRVADES